MNLEDSKNVMEKIKYDFELLREASHEYGGSFTHMCDSLVPFQYHNHQEIIMFDARCFHTALSRDQKDPTTRISIDIRIYPKKEYKKNKHTYQGLGRKKMQYTIGNAYNEQSILEMHEKT